MPVAVRSLASIVVLATVVFCAAAAPPAGYQRKVAVSAPTRIDWTFAVATQSLAEPPADWLPGYNSTRQDYELYVPARRDLRAPVPLVLFVSPVDEPMGWKHFEALCKQRGFAFAGPRGAGNDCEPKKRARIVLDVLDDVRRSVPIDPDRTYLAGFSGGGRIACAVAFALPEYFGGVLPICASGDLRSESWLQRRVIDRLSVAMLTGEKDFNRGEVERLRGPYLREVGVRSKVWTQPGLGHGIPDEKTLGEALRWLEDGAAARKELAKRFPATRAGEDGAGRAEQAAAVLAEGKKRLQDRKTLFSGLMLLQGCMKRWPDVAAGKEAKAVLLRYEEKDDKPWEAEDIAEQRRMLIARARCLDAYASGDLPPQYVKMRGDMARTALQLWQKVLEDSPDSDAGREAAKRISSLKKLAEKDD
jgi:predicted esterase